MTAGYSYMTFSFHLNAAGFAVSTAQQQQWQTVDPLNEVNL